MCLTLFILDTFILLSITINFISTLYSAKVYIAFYVLDV